MGSEIIPVLGRYALAFLAGTAAAAALHRGLYASAALGAVAALWVALLDHKALMRRTNRPAPPQAPIADGEGQRELRLYLDLSPAPLLGLDAAGRLRAINRAARRLFGADDRIAAPPPALIAAITATAPGRPATVRIDTGDGDHAFALATADLHTAGRNLRIAALTDIDADLKAAEAATLHDLVRVLGHEITNTLTPIAALSGAAAAMLDEAEPDLAAVRGAVETVARRAEALRRFGDAYRDFAQLPPPVIAPIDLAELLGDLAQLFRTRWPDKSLSFRAPVRLRVHGDADQLSQAIWALLQNAAEAGTTIILEVEPLPGGARLIVADNGPGIPLADREAIFRPFFTTKPAGSGVGLALARQVLRSHGGELRLIGDKGGPAIFEAVIAA